MKFVYKKFVATALIGTMLFGVSGCNSSKDKKDITTEIPTTESTDVTTEAISEEEIFENQLMELAQNSYAEYTEFYESVGATEEDVIKVANIVNTKVDGYSLGDIEATKTLINNMLLPEILLQALDNYNNSGITSKEIEKIYKLPHISDFIIDSNVHDIVARYEKTRDELVDQLNENKGYSKKLARKIEKLTAEMEIEEYDEFNGKMTSEISYKESGKLYALAASKCYMVELCKQTNPGKIYITGSDGKKLKIGYTSEEADTLDLVYSYDRQKELPPKDLYKEYRKIKEELIITRYEESMCSYWVQLQQEAGYSKASQIDILKQKKSLLQARKAYQDQLLTKSKSFSYKM